MRALFLALAALAVVHYAATAAPIADHSKEEVACAHTIAGASAAACTPRSCGDIKLLRGSCSKYCRALDDGSRRPLVVRKDCRARLAMQRWPIAGDEVIGGKAALRDEYGATVVIASYVQPGICSGALVSDKVVLTAGHCTDIATGGYVRTGGSLTRSEGERVSVLRVLPARGDPRPPGDVDLALIELKRPLGQPSLTIASDAMINATMYVRVVGFGLTEQGASGEKRYGDAAVASRDCSGEVPGSGKADAAFYGCKSGLELVAGKLRHKAAGGVDTCGGDSGGPALVARAEIATLPDPAQRFVQYNQDMAGGKYFLAAITSRAVDTHDVKADRVTVNGESVKCGSGGRYVRLSGATRAWIVKGVKDLGGRSVAVAP